MNRAPHTYGRYGDTTMVHMSPAEVGGLAAMSPTGSLTINPETGYPEAFLAAALPLIGGIAGTALAPALGMAAMPWLAGGIGTMLGTVLGGGSLADGLKSGLLSGALGFAGGKLLGSTANAATPAATAAPAGTTNVVSDGMLLSPSNLPAGGIAASNADMLSSSFTPINYGNAGFMGGASPTIGADHAASLAQSKASQAAAAAPAAVTQTAAAAPTSGLGKIGNWIGENPLKTAALTAAGTGLLGSLGEESRNVPDLTSGKGFFERTDYDVPPMFRNRETVFPEGDSEWEDKFGKQYFAEGGIVLPLEDGNTPVLKLLQDAMTASGQINDRGYLPQSSKSQIASFPNSQGIQPSELFSPVAPSAAMMNYAPAPSPGTMGPYGGSWSAPSNLPPIEMPPMYGAGYQHGLMPEWNFYPSEDTSDADADSEKPEGPLNVFGRPVREYTGSTMSPSGIAYGYDTSSLENWLETGGTFSGWDRYREDMNRDYGGDDFALGGIVGESQNQPQMPQLPPEQMEQIQEEAIMAIMGQHPNAELAIQQFIAVFGERAFEVLRQNIMMGPQQQQQPPARQVNGAPGVDNIPAVNVSDGQAAALSNGEVVFSPQAVGNAPEGAQGLDRAGKALAAGNPQMAGDIIAGRDVSRLNRNIMPRRTA